MACVEGKLGAIMLRWRKQAAVTVVIASQGYPNDPVIGVEITGIEEATAAGCTVDHAGTKVKEGRLLTASGRVLAVTALEATVEQAAGRAYEGVAKIKFNNALYRNDIGRPFRPVPHGKARSGKRG